MCSSWNRFKMIYYTLFTSILLSGLAFCDNLNTRSSKPTVKQAPKDYAYSPNGSRVRDLASFFESMKNTDGEEDTQNHNIIISLSEAASKLRFLSFGHPLETKCNKYVKLITQPNIRSFATINLLMREDKMFSDTQQADANLISKLLNERSFDALSKLQTILQTLESERSDSRSVFELDVQKDLLDCMNYYIYRHQRATSGITEYIRTSREHVLPFIANPSESEVALRKLTEQIDKIKYVESVEIENGKNSTSTWLKELSHLYKLLNGNESELPRLVIDFVTDEKRLARLNSIDPNVKIAPSNIQTSFNLEFSSLDPKLSLNNPPESTSSIFDEQVDELIDSSPFNELQSSKDSSSRSIPANDLQSSEVKASQQENSVEESSEKFEDKFNSISIPVHQATDYSVQSIPHEERNSDSDPVKLVTQNVLETTSNLPDSIVEAVDVIPDNSCAKYTLENSEYLQTLNWKLMEINKAESIANHLHKFKTDCLSKLTSEYWDVAKHSNWPFISMTRKLTSWSLNELKDLSKNQQTLQSILELLH